MQDVFISYSSKDKDITEPGKYLVMDRYNSWSQQTVIKECTFLPFSDIK